MIMGMRRHVSRLRTAGQLLMLAMVTTACGSGGMILPTDPAGTELFEEAQANMAAEKYRQASVGFDTLLRNYPTSPHLPEARIGLGRSYYEQGRMDTFLLSIDAFRNFLTYHPSHEQVDYAQLMISLSYMGLARSPDRDQSNTKRALDALDVFMEDYPNSSYREIAVTNRLQVVDTLAAHELQVAAWQLGRKSYEASRARAHYALRKYPESTRSCELLFTIGESHQREGDAAQARVYYERLVRDHADCGRADEARKRLQE